MIEALKYFNKLELSSAKLSLAWASADLEIILALLGSWDFDLEPTAKRGELFEAPTPLIIQFYCIFKLQFSQK